LAAGYDGQPVRTGRSRHAAFVSARHAQVGALGSHDSLRDGCGGAVGFAQSAGQSPWDRQPAVSALDDAWASGVSRCVAKQRSASNGPSSASPTTCEDSTGCSQTQKSPRKPRESLPADFRVTIGPGLVPRHIPARRADESRRIRKISGLMVRIPPGGITLPGEQSLSQCSTLHGATSR